jgi:hypothetical protein
MNKLTTCVVVGLALLFSSRSNADELLEEVIVGHAQYCESLQRIHVKFESITDSPEMRFGPRKRIVEWLQDGSSMRWRELTVGKVPNPLPTGQTEWHDEAVDFEVVSHNGKSFSLAKKNLVGKPTEYGAQIKLPADEDAQFVDMWARANFVVFDMPRMTISDLLKKSEWKKTAVKLRQNGKLLIRVTANCSRKNVDIYFDPQENYVAKRIVRYSGTFDPKKSHNESIIESVLAPSNASNVVFPKKTVMKSHVLVDGKLILAHWTDTTFTQVMVNPKIDSNTFSPPKIPRGTMVIDEIKGITYRSNEKGEPINPKSVRRLPPPILYEPEPPQSDWQWYLYLGLAVFGGLLVSFGLYRWWRSRSNP